MRKVALILSGAVSLGSFEAGVLTELLYVLNRLSRNGTKYAIDVITGASAGSMTAALVARAVMVNYEHRRFLHEAWVKEIDIRRLVEGIPDNALLSKKPILKIAENSLRFDPQDRVIPAPFAPPSLWLSLTLSNMNGIDYQLNPRDSKIFTSTFFADRRVFELTGERASDARYWDKITEAAIASGNFPMAFSPARVFTDPAEYKGCAIAPLPGSFTFVDGGYFNNEPIREAVLLARKVDGEELDPERVFLLVDANLNKSGHDSEFGPDASLIATVKRLFGILRGEASANDWLRARRLNNQIAWRDALFIHLVEIVKSNELSDPGQFIQQLRVAAQQIVTEKRKLFPNRYPADYLDIALQRTRKGLDSIAGTVSDNQAEIVTLMVFVLNSIAGLDKKSGLNMHVLCTEPDETAGDRLHSFGGFFEEKWREHDFRIGRMRAREILPGALGYQPGDVPREPGATYDNETDYSMVTIGDADREVREILRDSFVKKAKSILSEQALGPKWLQWATGPLGSWFAGNMIKKKLSSYLELS